MSYRAIVFDMDGTLLDTLEDLANAVNYVLEERGFPTHDLRAYHLFVGAGSKALITRALPPDHRDEAFVSECRDAFLARYRTHWDVKTRLYPQMPELLDVLTERRLHLAVLSNKPAEFTALCAERYLSRWPFAEVLGLREGLPAKPDPSGALRIAASFVLPPAAFVYVGDSGIDMETAVRAGMLPIGALWGYRSREELMAHGARAAVESPIDLLDWLE